MSGNPEPSEGRDVLNGDAGYIQHPNTGQKRASGKTAALQWLYASFNQDLAKSSILICVGIVILFVISPVLNHISSAATDFSKWENWHWIAFGSVFLFGVGIGASVGSLVANWNSHRIRESDLQSSLAMQGKKVNTALTDHLRCLQSAQRKLDASLQSIGVMSSAFETSVHFQGLTLFRPWEYMTLIDRVDRDFHTNKGKHLSEVLISGTMVGFAFLLPEALRNLKCRGGNHFKTLLLFASDATIEVNTQKKCLVNYPLWLAAKFVEKTVFECGRFRNRTQVDNDEDGFRIEIAYRNEDMLEASILMPPCEAVRLMALDTTTLLGLIENSESPQLGTRFINGKPENEQYERTFRVMNSYGTLGRKTKEIWKVSSVGPTLEITNPHWKQNKETGLVNLITTDFEYDKEVKDRNAVHAHGADEIRVLLNNLMHALQTQGHGSEDITIIQSKIDEAKATWCDHPNWPPEATLKCSCNRETLVSPARSVALDDIIPTT